jgi:hypothetical protein
MPQSTGTRASTQDSSAGTLVATAVDEVTSGNALQVVVNEGNKSTYSETSRLTITTPDAPTGGNVTNGSGGFGNTGLIDAGNAMAAALRATCTVASATLTGRLVLYDASGNCIGISTSIVFTSDPTLRLGNASGDFIAVGNQLVELAGARQCKFFVDTVSAGSWSLYLRPI